MHTNYQLRIKGHLDPSWADWFENLTMTPCEDGTMFLEGPIRDQSALYGILLVLRDLGVELISVTRVKDEPVCHQTM